MCIGTGTCGQGVLCNRTRRVHVFAGRSACVSTSKGVSRSAAGLSGAELAQGAEVPGRVSAQCIYWRVGSPTQGS